MPYKHNEKHKDKVEVQLLRTLTTCNQARPSKLSPQIPKH